MSIDERQSGDPISVSVITGFLGSGKTTLLNHLLAHPGMDQTAVLINEFGEVGLDHLMVKELDDDVVLLKSGCICCTVQGELVDGLKELYMKRLAGDLPPFTRVVIETTGLADPLPIITCLMRDPLFKHVFRLDGLITTVDAMHGEAQMDDHEEAVRQAAVADRILVTKTDLQSDAGVGRLRERLHGLNPGARILEARFGKVEPDRLFDTGIFDADSKTMDVQRWLNEEAYVDGEESAAHDHDHDHGNVDVNRHDAHIRSFCVRLDAPVDWSTFKDWYEELAEKRGDYILRVKGIVNIRGEDQPFAINCVQSTQHAPARLPAWPDADRSSRIVFITRDLGSEEIEASLELCLAREGGGVAPEPAPSAGGGRWLNDAELSRLFAALNGVEDTQAANALRLMLLTGVAVADLYDTRWEEFDLAREVWLKPQKPKQGTWVKPRPRRIALGPAVLVLLSSMRSRAPEAEELFPLRADDGADARVTGVWNEATNVAQVEHADLTQVRPVLASSVFKGLNEPLLKKLLGVQPSARRAAG
jgi:G3E family GTPase